MRLRLEDCEQQVQIANLCYKFSLHERGFSADWKAEREARSPSHLQVDVWAFRKWPPPWHADPLNRPSPNSESTELHSLAMLQTLFASC